jgi:uncharacterized membrane protein YcaP (DUF421 family)
MKFSVKMFFSVCCLISCVLLQDEIYGSQTVRQMQFFERIMLTYYADYIIFIYDAVYSVYIKNIG